MGRIRKGRFRKSSACKDTEEVGETAVKRPKERGGGRGVRNTDTLERGSANYFTAQKAGPGVVDGFPARVLERVVQTSPRLEGKK